MITCRYRESNSEQRLHWCDIWTIYFSIRCYKKLSLAVELTKQESTWKWEQILNQFVGLTFLGESDFQSVGKMSADRIILPERRWRLKAFQCCRGLWVGVRERQINKTGNHRPVAIYSFSHGKATSCGVLEEWHKIDFWIWFQHRRG